MRKFTIICMGIFLMLWGLNTAAFASDLNHSKRPKVGNVLTANAGLKNYEDSVGDEIKLRMVVDKVTTSSGESYDAQFHAEGKPLENVKVVRVKTPKGKNMVLKNPLGLSYMEIEAYDMSIGDFQKKFPEGKYQISLSPKKYGNSTFDMAYDFPPTPVVTNPAAGATDVSLTPTFEWESLADDDINGFLLILTTQDSAENSLELIMFLPKETTSFSVPEGFLEADTEYELDVVARKTFGENAYITSVRCIFFTTASAPLL